MPMDRGSLDQQLKALGEGSSWWEQRELRDLPNVLHDDEQLLAIARGRLGRLRVPRFSWLVVVTNARLLCLRSARTSWRQLEVPGSQIASVTLRVGMFRSRVRVVTSDRRYRLVVGPYDSHKLVKALSSMANCGQDTLSGPTQLVRRVVGHVLALPAAALNPYPARERATPVAAQPMPDARYSALEDQIQELQQQVQFLEQLLRQRQAASVVEPELQSSGSVD